MKVSQLRSFLRTAAAADVAALERALSAVDDLEIAELVAAIAPALAKEAKKQQAKAQKAAAITAAVTRYVDELLAEADNSETFEAIVRRIEKDREIKAGEARDIAARFLGTPSKHKSKKDALKAVLQRQITDRRARVRGAQVSGLF